MKSTDSIVKFLSVFSAISSKIGSLGQSCEPPEQTDLPDPCKAFVPHIALISCARAMQLLAAAPLYQRHGQHCAGLCQAWDGHNPVIGDRMNEWEENGRLWQWLRWSWTLEIMLLFFSLQAELSQKCHTSRFGLVTSLGHVVHLGEYIWISQRQELHEENRIRVSSMK